MNIVSMVIFSPAAVVLSMELFFNVTIAGSSLEVYSFIYKHHEVSIVINVVLFITSTLWTSHSVGNKWSAWTWKLWCQRWRSNQRSAEQEPIVLNLQRYWLIWPNHCVSSILMCMLIINAVHAHVNISVITSGSLVQKKVSSSFFN